MPTNGSRLPIHIISVREIKEPTLKTRARRVPRSFRATGNLTSVAITFVSITAAIFYVEITPPLHGLRPFGERLNQLKVRSVERFSINSRELYYTAPFQSRVVHSNMKLFGKLINDLLPQRGLKQIILST